MRTVLGVDERIAVDLAGARVEKTAARVASQVQKIQNAQHRALERLDRIGLQIEKRERKKTW